MNNSLCFIGPHRKYNAFSGTFQELVPGQVNITSTSEVVGILFSRVSRNRVRFASCCRAISERMHVRAM